MVQKEDSGGIVMLIKEPKEPSPKIGRVDHQDIISLENMRNNNRSGNNSRNASRNQSVVPSRRTSTSTMPDLIPASSSSVTTLGTPATLMARSRRASNIVNPLRGINEEITTKSLLQDVVGHLEYHHNNRKMYIDKYLNIGEGVSYSNNGGNEYVRKVSVQSLEDCRIASAESAFTRLLTVMEETTEHDVKKIFSAIHQQDLPLALFYLGIPAEELAN